MVDMYRVDAHFRNYRIFSLSLLICALPVEILVRLRILSVAHAIALEILGRGEIPAQFLRLILHGFRGIFKTTFGCRRILTDSLRALGAIAVFL